MPNLTKTDWPGGWNPSSDNENGSPDALLRMDNLQQDDTGCITLVRGIQKLNSSAFSSFIEKMICRSIDGVDTLYVALQDGNLVLKAPNLAGFTSIVAGSDHAAMDDCLGQMLICAGTVKKKEAGGTVKDLGLVKPDPPTIGAVNQPKLDLTGSWTLVEGHDLSGNQWYVDKDSLHGTAYINYGADKDTTSFGSSDNYDLNQDIFNILVQLGGSSNFTDIRVDIVVGGTADSPTDYYSFAWTEGDPQFVLGRNAQSILSCKRGDFIRTGNTDGKDWKTVKFLRVTGVAITDIWIIADEAEFVGGPQGVLQGFYEYAQQSVYNNGVYLAKSPLSDPSVTTYFNNGHATVSPSSIIGANEYWIFRRSVIQQVDSNILQSHLAKWYQVGVSTGGGIDDDTSDVEAIELNITVNEFLISVQDIPESILDIIGLDGDRTLYMTAQYIYLSDHLNPDAVDTRFTLKAFGGSGSTEKNLFLKQVTNSTRILGTTKDLYEISGTLLDLPDGTLDVVIRRIGEAFPPLGANVAQAEGGIYYVAKDGLRVTNGSNSINLSPELAQLFNNKNCHGVPPVAILTGGVADYDICIGRSKIYLTTLHTDGTRRLLVFDTIKKTWRLQFTDPISLCATTNGKILAGYGGGSGNFVREIDSGTGVDGAGGLPLTLLTVYDANGQPRNRKDTFTLKLVLDTGGKDVTLSIAKDGGAFTTISSTIHSTGQSTKYFDINSYTLGFRYAIKIVDTNGDIETFKLYEYTIEYEPRPEQNLYLRIPNSNLGTQSRKRFVNYAFVIDTLGSDVTFTPYIDNAAQSTSTVNKATKLTHIHYFTSEKIGTDIGGILQSTTPFEFYQLNSEEIVSEKLPTPVEYLVIPANDYGNPNRKRHTSYKFQIHTRGFNVQFTPRVDGTSYATAVFNTTEKRTVEYFFDTLLDVKGIDIGGILQSLQTTPFEFYGVIVPQKIELLPDRLKSYYIPFDNLGVAARKRVRTLPIIIDTYGFDVTFTPIVDGVELGSTVLNSDKKQTLYHYFITDVFGTDFGGTLIGDNPFEFYQFGNPEEVEVLPVPKRFDQFQPLRWDKIGKLFAIRVRLIMTGSTTSLPFSIYSDDSPTIPINSNALFSDNLVVIPNTDNVYEYKFRKNINGTMLRVTLGPTADPFHRYDMLARVATSGMESDSKWMPLR